MHMTAEFSTTGQLWSIERRLSTLAREIETLTECLTMQRDSVHEHADFMNAHLMELRRIIGQIAATRRRLP
jgi:uncharacterized protein YlxW (UPF0749 family)